MNLGTGESWQLHEAAELLFSHEATESLWEKNAESFWPHRAAEFVELWSRRIFCDFMEQQSHFFASWSSRKFVAPWSSRICVASWCWEMFVASRSCRIFVAYGAAVSLLLLG